MKREYDIYGFGRRPVDTRNHFDDADLQRMQSGKGGHDWSTKHASTS